MAPKSSRVPKSSRLPVVLAALAVLATAVDAVRRPDGLRTASTVVAVGWLLTAAGCDRARLTAPARLAAVLTISQAAAAVWPSSAPLTLAAWTWGGLALPDGRLDHPRRRTAVALVYAVATAWTVLAWRSTAAHGPAAGITAAGVLAATAVIVAGVARRCRQAGAARRRVLQWVAAGTVTAGAADAVLLALHILVGLPAALAPWALAALVLIPVGSLLGQLPSTARLAERALLEAVTTSGLACLVVAVYLVTVVGLGRAPVGREHDVLAYSVTAALVCAALALPVRLRLNALGRSLLRLGELAPEEALSGFGARMTRALPFDELLLQLAESLRATLGPAGAEIWVGGDGLLTRTVSVPDRPQRRIRLTEHERAVVGRTRIGGAGWTAIWMADLLADPDRDPDPDREPGQDPGPDGDPLVRVAPAAHGGELLGLLLVRRPADAAPYSEADDRVLVELARQVGLALHNVRLDSALQASLQELRSRNQELRDSRLRLVTAADASRREIERNLHDGAQQHLVALSVKLALVRELVDTADGGDEDRATVTALLEELRTDVQGTVAAVRELAHGIYPPLLRNHGLGQALRSATRRSVLPCTVSVELPGRYPEAAEAAVYFCCLEALQNAGKHAGPDASVTVLVEADDGMLRFRVSDDGRGFAADGAAAGSGFVNMADRLGAIGGRLTVESRPGQGTAVGGEIPVPAAPPTSSRSSEGVRSSLWT
ncbi:MULTISPECIES: ATP-binding protein [Streptacidiphilus]|uniref:histidine kinase n=1 Tax=Streptacidiphilus cavernicola TaxID=3342716 RepID=A0ABV6UR37_9ACTN|nr:ATP-binding protein [Streptacidiphilus jeojiense]